MLTVNLLKYIHGEKHAASQRDSTLNTLGTKKALALYPKVHKPSYRRLKKMYKHTWLQPVYA